MSRSRFTSAWFPILLACAVLAADRPAAAEPPAADVPVLTIDAAQKGAPISPYIYGQFIEHLGNCIYGGIWAEMVEDRKFFHPAGQKPSPWTVVGPPGAVRMAEEGAFVNGHSPEIRAAGAEAGLAQGGLAVRKGRSYTGRVWLSGDAAATPVEVRLVWGDGPAGRQAVRIGQLGAAFERHALSFEPAADCADARIEIVGLGTGAFRVGAVSLMPADNVKGMRPDVLALLKELDAPVYRWPGGNFVSGYDWRDGIGDPDRRPTRRNPAWQGIEPNDFGMHEYIAFCRAIATEPMVTVNTGFGDAYSAAAELEYANGGADTPMGALRARNGSPEPFRVKFWCIGNEMWGPWQLGHMALDHYVRKHNWVVDKMREVDAGIVTFASGNLGTKAKDRTWSEGLLVDCRGRLDYLAEHFYVQEKKDVAEHAGLAAAKVRSKAEDFRRLREKLGMADSPVRVAMTEWNHWYGPHVFGELGTRYFLKDGLGIAAGLHEFFRQSDVFFMANYAQTVNVIGCIKATKADAALETTGLALALYRRHFGSVPVAVRGAPAPLDAMAALTADGKALTVGVVNPAPEPRRLALAIEGAARRGPGRSLGFGGGDPMAFNDPGHPPAFSLREAAVAEEGPVEVGPYSATVLVLPLR